MNDIIIEQMNNITLKNEIDNPNIKLKHKSEDEDYVKNYNKMYYEKKNQLEKKLVTKITLYAHVIVENELNLTV